jgi:hypothetical protein
MLPIGAEAPVKYSTPTLKLCEVEIYPVPLALHGVLLKTASQASPRPSWSASD